MLRLIVLYLTMVFSLAATAGDQPKVTFHPIPGTDGSLSFSDAVQVGNLLFLTGMLGNVNDTYELAEGGIRGETQEIMKKIKAAVERYGSNMDNVVKCTVFLADMAEWSTMNEVYTTFFPNNKPARSAVGVNGLALDARVEIECIAVIP